MREIKFRAWWSGTSRPVTAHMVEWEELCAEHIPYGFFPLNGDTSWTLMQYTGLKDSTGREIYEGDILGTPFGNAQIFYAQPAPNSAFYWGAFYDGSNRDLNEVPYSAFEIIGNIYENPELLEE